MHAVAATGLCVRICFAEAAVQVLDLNGDGLPWVLFISHQLVPIQYMMVLACCYVPSALLPEWHLLLIFPVTCPMYRQQRMSQQLNEVP